MATDQNPIISHPHPDIVMSKIVREPTADEFQTYLDILTEQLSRPRPYVTIIWMEARYKAPADQRNAMVGWISDNRERLEEISAGTAFIVTSAVSQFLLAAMMLLVPMPGAVKSFRTEEEAYEWALNQLLARAEPQS